MELGASRDRSRSRRRNHHLHRQGQRRHAVVRVVVQVMTARQACSVALAIKYAWTGPPNQPEASIAISARMEANHHQNHHQSQHQSQHLGRHQHHLVPRRAASRHDHNRVTVACGIMKKGTSLIGLKGAAAHHQVALDQTGQTRGISISTSKHLLPAG